MLFASFFSGGFITATVVNPPERKLAKHTSAHLGEGGPSGITKNQKLDNQLDINLIHTLMAVFCAICKYSAVSINFLLFAS